jgi:hypothetical protein
MNPELEGLISAAKSVAEDARVLFGDLNEAQLNWQPDAESWSVGLCLEHLIKTNDELLGAVEPHVAGAHRKTIFEQLALGSGFFGNYVLKAVQPETKAKIKAPKVFRPETSNVNADVVERFVANQQKIIALMKRSAQLDLQKTIVTSPVAPVVVYSLWHAFKIVVTHERRHFRQAQNVMNLSEFPKKLIDG